MPKKKKAALVCSGGGALGLIFLGILDELQKEYDFDFYAGVSAGALIAAFHATGKTAQEIVEIIDDKELFKLAFDFSKTNFGILRGEKIHKNIDKIVDEKKIEDLESPLYIGATDFSNGERVILSKGKIADALRASFSVPVLFEPFHHPDTKEWLVDGGLSQNLPLDLAIEKYKGDRIIALDITGLNETIDFTKRTWFGSHSDMQKVWGRIFKIFFKNQQHFEEDKRVEHFRITADEFDSFDVFKLKEMYEWGKKYAKKEII